jgi:putative ATPase
MLQGGEDPLYIARRLVRAASEDIGLADNTALPLVSRMQNNGHKDMGSF